MTSIPANPKELFTGKAEIYAQCRPSYPAELLKWLQENADLTAVADIGAGTGIFTAELLKICGQLTAVEPNQDMRQMFQSFLPQVKCLHGSAEAIPLPDDTLTLITAAQAFHWFDEEIFRTECRRLFRPGGQLLLVWNNYKDSPVSQRIKEVCQKYCPSFRSGHAGARSAEAGDRFLRECYFQTLKLFSCTNPQYRTQKDFIGDQLSRSYALPPDSPDHQRYIDELREVFQQFAVNGILQENYEVSAYLGMV